MRVLLIDDDARLHDILSAYLLPNGVTLTSARDGVAGLALLEPGGAGAPFDLVLLDVMMPGPDGLEVCRRIRGKSAVPVIMLTAKGDETDRVVGLELGADDYVGKPFSPRELLARMRAVVRRTHPSTLAEVVTTGGLVLVPDERSATFEAGAPGGAGGEKRVLDLTAIEFDLLLALARRAGRVVPRDALLAHAGRGDVSVGERTVDVHVSHLRQKLGDDPRAPRIIKTVRGVGYVLVRDKP